jgi:hypothetical protein
VAFFVLQKNQARLAEYIDPGKLEALLIVARLWRHHSTIGEPQECLVKEREDFISFVDRFSDYSCSGARDRIYAVYSRTLDVAPTEQGLENVPHARIDLHIDYSLDI